MNETLSHRWKYQVSMPRKYRFESFTILKMAGIVCCVYHGSPSRGERIKLPSFNLSETVDSLMIEISKHVAIAPDEIQIITCGKLLNGADTLESCGVKPGVTVHAVRKLNIVPPEKMDTSELGLQSLILALKSAVRNPAYRSTVRRLSKPDVWENINAVTPGLANDPIAIAILQDPDILMQFTDMATMQRAIETHPALAEAINHVVAAVQEDSVGASTSSSSAGAAASSSGRPGLPGFLNLLWDMSDDDDDFSQSDQMSISDVPRTPNQPERFPFPAITPAQLASALAAVATAGDQGSDSSAAGSQSTTGTIPSTPVARLATASSSSQSPSIVTPEIFSHAVQQAMTSATAQNQLQQLRDMGITDDAASLRALEITNGDVQAALELIFGGGDIFGDGSNQ